MQRPFDASIQIRTYRTTIATLAKFYVASGIPITSTSALTRRALDDFKDACVLQGYVAEITSTTEASEILERLNMRSGTRTQRQFLTNLQLDNFKAEGIAPIVKGDRLVGGAMTFEEEPVLDTIRTIPDNLIAEEETSNENGDDKEKSG